MPSALLPFDGFFGYKPHRVVNDPGKLLNLMLTAGNINDHQPVPQLLDALLDQAFAERGYV